MLLTRDMSFTVVCNIRTPIGDNRDRVGTGIFINKDNNAYVVGVACLRRSVEYCNGCILCYCDQERR